jgi:hypothetical protein
MTTCHSNEHDATDLRVGSVCVINNSFADAVATDLRVGSVCVINNSFADAVASVQHGNAHYQH